MQHDIADFCQERLSIAFRLEIDQRAGPRANGLVLPRHVELAVRRAVDLETTRSFLVHFGRPHPVAPRED